MLYFVGLGLSDETDITVKGLEVVKKAKRVYLEGYTSILLVDKPVLQYRMFEKGEGLKAFYKQEAYYGRPVILADRDMVESNSDEILRDAQTEDVAFLVVGDPFGATTHTDLALRARRLKISTTTIPNASILSAIGSTGLQLYNFGQTTSMVFFTPTWRPSSFYDRVRENRSLGLHTLILLDIKVKEPNLERLVAGGSGSGEESRRVVYDPPRYMTVGVCARQMLQVEEHDRREGVYARDSLAIAAARVGAATPHRLAERFVAGTLDELCHQDDVLGPPLHCLVLLGRKGHDLEREFAREWAVDKDKWDRIWDQAYGKQV